MFVRAWLRLRSSFVDIVIPFQLSRQSIGLLIRVSLVQAQQREPLWGCSSAGRAPALQAGGHGFESHHLHHTKLSSQKCESVYNDHLRRLGIIFGFIVQSARTPACRWISISNASLKGRCEFKSHIQHQRWRSWVRTPLKSPNSTSWCAKTSYYTRDNMAPMRTTARRREWQEQGGANTVNGYPILRQVS